MSASEEIAEWKKTIPKTIQIVTATTNARFLSFKYERTPYVRAKVTLNFPDDYPVSPLIVTIERGDGCLAPGLTKKLIREMEQVAKSKLHEKQVQPVTQHLVDFLDTNRFASCWKELRKLVDISNNQSKEKQHQKETLSVVSVNETKGIIRLKMTHGDYFYECKLLVNAGYPSTSNLDDPIQLLTVKTNFPKQIVEDIVAKHAKGFVRNMQDGVPEEKAWSRSNPITKPDDQQPNYNEEEVSEPIPSLLPLVSMLQTKLQQLPQTQCPVCQTPVLPNQPKQLEALYEKKPKAHQQQPIYSSCGCWYHYKCLDKFLAEPPYGESPCQGGCSGRQQAYHPDWPKDMQERKRLYEQRQARQREMDDVAMMF